MKRTIERAHLAAIDLLDTARQRIMHVRQEDRGDVPGWVLITVMTAGLVVAIWSVAGPELKSVLNDALRTVTAP